MSPIHLFTKSVLRSLKRGTSVNCSASSRAIGLNLSAVLTQVLSREGLSLRGWYRRALLSLGLALVCCFTVPTISQAAHQYPYQPTVFERFYGDIHYAYGGVAHSDLEFNPSFVSLSGGVWLWPGIGVEGYFDQGLNESRQGNFELEWTNTSGFAARFQSPAKNGFFAYILLGMAFTHLEQSESDSRGERTVVQNYQGGRLSIGFGQRYPVIPGLVVVAEYRNYFVDEELNLDAISLGLRFDLQ